MSGAVLHEGNSDLSARVFEYTLKSDNALLRSWKGGRLVQFFKAFARSPLGGTGRRRRLEMPPTDAPGQHHRIIVLQFRLGSGNDGLTLRMTFDTNESPRRLIEVGVGETAIIANEVITPPSE